MRRYDPVRKLLTLPAPPRPSWWLSADFYPYPGNYNADGGLGPAAADLPKLHSVPCVWALCRHSLSSLLNKGNKQNEILTWGRPLPWGMASGVGFCSHPQTLAKHPALAQLAGSAKSLGLPLFRALCKTAIVVGLLCWAVLGQEKVVTEGQKKTGALGVQFPLPSSLPSFAASRVLISSPATSPLSTPKSQLDFHSRKERGGNVQTRWNPQSQCFYCRFHTFGQIDISFQGKSPRRCQEMEIYILL